MFNGKSHSKTTGLIEVARCIGQFQVMHYKWIYQRMRPSQVSPALMPPINPPGHAAFPSGHATESMLMALLLEKVMPVAASAPPPPIPSPAPVPAPWSPLQMMAQRVARNREVIGLHYRSDSEAGRVLGQNTFDIIMNQGQCPTIQKMVQDASKEWQ